VCCTTRVELRRIRLPRGRSRGNVAGRRAPRFGEPSTIREATTQSGSLVTLRAMRRAVLYMWMSAAAAGCSEDVASRTFTDAVQVSAGVRHTCARRASGDVACWGFNLYGQLGDGASMHEGCIGGFECSPMPVAVAGLTDSDDVSSGGEHACAHRRSGEVVCWGDNSLGQAGDGITSRSSCPDGPCAFMPVGVSGLSDAVTVSAGFVHSCALRASGGVACWGSNMSGQLGGAPATVSTCVTSGTPTACSATPVTVVDLADAIAVAAGGHTCALRATGEVVCWGSNDCGQLGDGTLIEGRRPVTVPGLNQVVQVSTGTSHTCARRASGEVLCWGRDDGGELGDGLATHTACRACACSPTPVLVSGLTDAIDISANGVHTCALRASGEVVCWGGNASGQLGDGVATHEACPGEDCSRLPVAVSGLEDAVQISSGMQHTCARRASGAVVCWGDNSAGALGTNATLSVCRSGDVDFDCSRMPVAVAAPP